MTPVLAGLALLATTALADTPLDTLPQRDRTVFEAAERAWQAGDLEAAETGYASLNQSSPDFDRAWRRRCGVMLAQGRVWEAVEHCDKAVNLSASIENRTGLAIALTQPADGDAPGERPELLRAKELLDGVLYDQQDYLPAWQALCSWSMEAAHDDALIRCVEKLESKLPGEVGTLYFRTVLDLQEEAWEHALTTLQAARARGLSDALFQPLALRLQTEQRPAQEQAATRIRTVANLQPRTEWAWRDVIPLGIAGLLVLAVFLVAFFGGSDDDE
jgi:tetratricopeptide (TPR) repeat protein